MSLDITAIPDPTQRSPLEYFHGLYVVDSPLYGGASAFLWFEDDAAALHHIQTYLPCLYLEADTTEGEVLVVRKALQSALFDTRELKQMNLADVNAALSGLCQIRWAGSLDDLRYGDSDFEREVQGDFHHNVFGDERGFTESDWDDFAHHITNYNG